MSTAKTALVAESVKSLLVTAVAQVQLWLSAIAKWLEIRKFYHFSPTNHVTTPGMGLCKSLHIVLTVNCYYQTIQLT